MHCVAGERMVPISAIGHDGENARMSGRCGFGAVMGLEEALKAVAAVGNMETEVADPALMAQQRKWSPNWWKR